MTSQPAHQPHPYLGGRTDVLRALAAWRSGAADAPGTVLLTGRPGSGRSHLLTGFLMLCDPEHRARIDLTVLDPATVPPAELPPPPVFGAAGLTAAQLLWLVADELGLGATRSQDVYTLLAHPQEQPVPVVVADVDRAGVLRSLDERARVAAEVLLPLAQAPGIRLLADVPQEQARWLAERLSPGDVLILDLDQEPWADPAALLLQARATVENPGLAAETARRADGPLVVQLVARSLLAVPEGVWEPAPTTVGEILDLHAERCGADELTLRRLLAPLALAGEGAELPFSLWEPLASAIAGRDLSRTFARAQHLLTPFFDVVEPGGSGEEPAVRLAHPAIADELRERFGGAVRETQRRIATALTAGLPAAPDRWAAASPYTRAQLVGHALEGGLLPELLAEPGFLLHAGQVPLRAAVEHLAATGTDLPALARTWLRLAPLFTRTEADPVLRAALLEHACHQDALPAPEFGIDLPWQTLWAHPLPGVGSVAAAVAPDGTPALVARIQEEDPRLVAYDARTGALLEAEAAEFLRPSQEQRAACPLRLSVGGDYVRIWEADGRQAAVFVSPGPLGGADTTPDGLVLLADSHGVSALRPTVTAA
ncbi:ATP-binding protein [Kitasatospora sp. NBC_00374]|uniref:ATP-binding protein n=1 Tax=Kitasatospora sp. NBC_00374 TaxID=2975964 RepID=UPI0030DE051D